MTSGLLLRILYINTQSTYLFNSIHFNLENFHFLVTMSTTTVPLPDKFIKSFPHPIITPICGQPTYNNLADLKKKLSVNAASIQSSLGGGAHGYLWCVLLPAQFATLSGTAGNVPVFPGVHPNYAAGATAAQI